MRTKLNYKDLEKVSGGQLWQIKSKNGIVFYVVSGKDDKGQETYETFFTNKDAKNWHKLNWADNKFINILNKSSCNTNEK